jgi:hypothetical protein
MEPRGTGLRRRQENIKVSDEEWVLICGRTADEMGTRNRGQGFVRWYLSVAMASERSERIDEWGRGWSLEVRLDDILVRSV